MKLEKPKNNGSYVKTEPRKTFPSRTYLQFSFPQKAVFSRFPFETKNRIAISYQDEETCVYITLALAIGGNSPVLEAYFNSKIFHFC